MIKIGGWNSAQKWWGDLMKTLTFLTGLYFPKRHSNYVDLLIDTIADIITKNHTGWKILILTHPQKLNVWAGILGNTIIRPFFLNENVNAEHYLLLQNQVLFAIQNRWCGFQNQNSVWFQQDSAPHFGINVRQFLNQTFPGK